MSVRLTNWSTQTEGAFRLKIAKRKCIEQQQDNCGLPTRVILAVPDAAAQHMPLTQND
eukprot:CAMPEP_0117595232 /NCGR_PEP_ID=MMETSP0784-20121206/73649_1 /TAXON_ID=39447 /ORGANISM="" /LENGTH=57 /DNA_ID=CAMNT_0005397393 /DNA_START=81 /DNA_END=251 /DNA_ORIENTATION=-